MSLTNEMPQVVRDRLNWYLKILKDFRNNGLSKVSSRAIAEGYTLSTIDSSTVRRDFGYLGKLGRQGSGYEINALITLLTEVLGIGKDEEIMLFGVGNMGKALLKYNELQSRVGKIVAAYDVVPPTEGNINGIPIYSIDKLKQHYRPNVQIAIIAVPTAAAQELADKLIELGFKVLINFSDADLMNRSRKVIIRNIDLAYFIQDAIHSLKIHQLL